MYSLITAVQQISPPFPFNRLKLNMVLCQFLWVRNCFGLAHGQLQVQLGRLPLKFLWMLARLSSSWAVVLRSPSNPCHVGHSKLAAPNHASQEGDSLLATWKEAALCHPVSDATSFTVALMCLEEVSHRLHPHSRDAGREAPETILEILQSHTGSHQWPLSRG